MNRTTRDQIWSIVNRLDIDVGIHIDSLHLFAEEVLKEFGNEEKFFIQDSRNYIGNSMSFWAAKGGYTTNLDKAAIFTEEHAKEICSQRDSDVMLKVSNVMANAIKTVEIL